jgi:integrase
VSQERHDHRVTTIARPPSGGIPARGAPEGRRKGPAPRSLPRGNRQAPRKAPERFRPIIGVAVLAGLRQAEVLGLRWSEVDFKAGVLEIRHRLTRGDRTTPPRAARLKTKAGRRDVILLPDLVQRQMGHARPSITSDLYVHEFDTARRREQVSDRLAAALGGLITPES